MTMVVQMTEVTVDDMDEKSQGLIKKDIAKLAFGDTERADQVLIDQMVAPEDTANRRRQLIDDNVSNTESSLSETAAGSSSSGVDFTVILILPLDEDEDALAEDLETQFNDGTFMEELKILEKEEGISTFTHSRLKAYIIYGNADIRVGGSSQEEPSVTSFEDAVGAIFNGGPVVGTYQIPWSICWLAALAVVAFALGSYWTYRKVISAKLKTQKPGDAMHARAAGEFLA